MTVHIAFFRAYLDTILKALGFSLTIVSKNERFHLDRFDGNGGNFAWNRVPFSSNSESPSICTTRLSQCFYIILCIENLGSLF